MVPSILNVHQRFLDELKHRLDAWDNQQIVGDAFIEVVRIFNDSSLLHLVHALAIAHFLRISLCFIFYEICCLFFVAFRFSRLSLSSTHFFQFFTLQFSKSIVLEAYTLFVNNWNRAKDIIRHHCQQRPAFGRFLEAASREHKGKLTLDNLLIKPVQKFPK